jgi:beta-lactam-binding protein with PASTA domain
VPVAPTIFETQAQAQTYVQNIPEQVQEEEPESYREHREPRSNKPFAIGFAAALIIALVGAGVWFGRDMIFTSATPRDNDSVQAIAQDDEHEDENEIVSSLPEFIVDNPANDDPKDDDEPSYPADNTYDDAYYTDEPEQNGTSAPQETEQPQAGAAVTPAPTRTPAPADTPAPTETAAPTVTAPPQTTPAPAADVVHISNVVGQSRSAAERTLQNQGFTVRVVESHHTATAGNVFSQSPPAGAALARGGQVTLNVSLGRGQGLIEVPNVVDMVQSAARNNLRGFANINVVEAFHDSIRAGHVISLCTPAGSLLPRDHTITLTVSRGREMLVVPSVVGQGRGVAENNLRNAGFVVTVSESGRMFVSAGNVISQTPVAGDSQPRGHNIAIIVSSGHAAINQSPETFPNLRSGWGSGNTYTFTVDWNSSGNVTEVGVVIQSRGLNEATHRITTANANGSHVFHLAGDAWTAGDTYSWRAYAIVDGERVFSPLQTFIFRAR